MPLPDDFGVLESQLVQHGFVKRPLTDRDVATGAGIQRSKVATSELAYVEFTSNKSSTSTTFALGTSVVSAGALTFDGLTKIRVEFFSPTASTTANNAVISLSDGGAAGTDLGWIAIVGSTLNVPVYAVREFTPPAATKTYGAVLWVTAAATGTVTAGVGGAGVRFPGFIRISRA